MALVEAVERPPHSGAVSVRRRRIASASVRRTRRRAGPVSDLPPTAIVAVAFTAPPLGRHRRCVLRLQELTAIAAVLSSQA